MAFLKKIVVHYCGVSKITIEIADAVTDLTPLSPAHAHKYQQTKYLNIGWRDSSQCVKLRSVSLNCRMLSDVRSIKM